MQFKKTIFGWTPEGNIQVCWELDIATDLRCVSTLRHRCPTTKIDDVSIARVCFGHDVLDYRQNRNAGPRF